MKGVYGLVISTPYDIDVQIGSLGIQRFESGDWVYIGSAFGDGSTSLEHRIRRHISNEKRLHWHIDLLLEVTGPPSDVIWAESDEKKECVIANELKQHPEFREGPKGFGASDCRAGCETHLFKYTGAKTWNALEKLFLGVGLEPRLLKDLYQRMA